MIKYVKDILLFIFPLLLVGASICPLYFMVKSTGELNSTEDIVEKQWNNSNCLVGLGYNEQTPFYKLLNANHYKAPIISLGTSRVMQFKQFFFSSQFYNCGGAVEGNFNEYKNFIENLDYSPEIIIIGLDTWVFNDAWNRNYPQYNSFQEIKEFSRGTIPLMKIIADWIARKWSVDDLNLYPENIGFNGKVKDNGFMYDGSYYYGNIYRDPTSSTDYKFGDTKKRIAKGVSRFEWGAHIDESTLIQLDNLLSYCQKNNINVIGFLPPFAPSIYNMMKNSGNYNYLTEIAPACKKIFEKYNLEFYDFMDGENLDMPDEYYIDGFHGSEIVYGHILEKLVMSNSAVSQYVNTHKIRHLIDNAYSGYTFYNPFNHNKRN